MYVVLRGTWIYVQFPRTEAWGKEGDVRAPGLGGCMGGDHPLLPGLAGLLAVSFSRFKLVTFWQMVVRIWTLPPARF